MPRHFIVTAGQSSSTVSLNWDGSRRPAAPIALMKWIQEPASTTGEPRFPKAVNWETYDRQIQVTVAHWFLILVFLLPWTAFLLWRHRRMKRFAVTAGSTEET